MAAASKSRLCSKNRIYSMYVLYMYVYLQPKPNLSYVYSNILIIFSRTNHLRLTNTMIVIQKNSVHVYIIPFGDGLVQYHFYHL